jgi:hypothetical protein
MKRPPLSVWIIIALIAGCAVFGIPKPNTVNERLAVAYAAHTAVLDGASAALNFDRITVAEGEQVLALADHSRLMLDAARAVAATDNAEAEARLKLAIVILDEVDEYLRARQAQWRPQTTAEEPPQ